MRVYRKLRRIKKKKSILKNRFFWLSILTLIILGGIFYFLIFSSFFQIEIVAISGNKKIPEREIKKIIEENIENKILFFPTKSIFLFNSNKIKEDILANYPQIAIVDVHRGFPKSLNILITERLAIAVFCKQFQIGENEKIQTEEICFLIDQEGVVFEKDQPKKDLVKIVGEKKEEGLSLGEQVIEKEYLEKILQVQKSFLEEIGIEVNEFFVFPERFNVKTTKGWEIYFSLEKEIQKQISTLSLVLEKEIPPEKRRDLEYIDLRFTRVYYKYR